MGPLIPRFSRTRLSIFISYRRDDSSGYAGRLRDDLREALGENHVRMDIGGLEYGVDFVASAKEIIAGSDVLLLLIGKRWADPVNAPRLSDAADLLRQEIETAFANELRVIPILLNGAAMPEAALLPQSLAPLLSRNAFELSEARWDYDVRRLVATLRKTPSRRATKPVVAGVSQELSRRLRVWGWAAVLCIAIGIGALWFVSPLKSNRDTNTSPSRRAAPAVAPDVRSEIEVDDALRGPFRLGHETFLDEYANEFQTSLTERQRSGLDTLLFFIESDTALKDLRWAAYILATVKFETGNTWWPIEESGKGRGRRYGDSVTVIDPEGHPFTNSYYGRGYTQLTLEENYRKMGIVLHNRLLYEPDLALQPDVAYRTMLYRMRNGGFTGHRLSNYINSDTCDYVAARKVVNGTNDAVVIASDAVKFERILRRSEVPPQGGVYFVTTEPVIVRSGPDVSYAAVSRQTLPRNTVVTALEYRGGWRRVVTENSGTTGWVPARYLAHQHRPASSVPK